MHPKNYRVHQLINAFRMVRLPRPLWTLWVLPKLVLSVGRIPQIKVRCHMDSGPLRSPVCDASMPIWKKLLDLLKGMLLTWHTILAQKLQSRPFWTNSIHCMELSPLYVLMQGLFQKACHNTTCI